MGKPGKRQLSGKAKLVLLLFSLAMTLAVCEIGIRLAGVGTGRQIVGWKRDDYLALLRKDDRFRGYVLIPNIREFRHKHDLLDYDYVIRTGEMDSIGYRLHDQGAADEVRPAAIWSFGDSFTFGFGLEEEKTYSSLLSGSGYGCVNLGVPGFTLLQEFLLFNYLYEQAERKPDIVLFSIFWGNDIPEHGLVSEKREPAITAEEDPFAHVGLLGRGALRADEFIAARSALYRFVVDRSRSLSRKPECGFEVPEGVFIQPHHLKAVDLDTLPYNLVSGFMEEAKLFPFEEFKGTRFYLLLFPSKEMLLWARSNPGETKKIAEVSDMLQDALKGRKVTVIDYFRPALESPDSVFYPVDTHFNERGHAMVADILLRKLAGD